MFLTLQLLLVWLSVVAALDNSFFTNVELRDAISGSAHTFDPTSWLVIEAELFVVAGQDKDIFLSIPEDFTSMAQTPFHLLHNSQKVGRVIAEDNVLTVSFPRTPTQNVTATFSLVARLSNEALYSLDEPQRVEYKFYSSQGEKFTLPMHYMAKNLNEVTVKGGVYHHNKSSWFAVDIPVAQLEEPVYIVSEPKAGTNSKIITDMTRCDLVTSVNAFHEPTIWAPLEPLTSLSLEASIIMHFDKHLEGEYVRITYFTELVEESAAGGQVNYQQDPVDETKLSDYAGGLASES